MSKSVLDRLRIVLPSLSDATAEALLAAGAHLSLPVGAAVFEPGAPAAAFFLLLRGRVRVETMAESGRGAVLYRITPGESCVMTTSCLLSGRALTASARVEEAAEALALAPAEFNRLLSERADFRALAFNAFAERLAELAGVIDALLLRRVDARLAQRLAGGPNEIETTHEALAFEFGSAREVVSRILKAFERRGWLALGRGRIAVRDQAALAAFARDHGAGDL